MVLASLWRGRERGDVGGACGEDGPGREWDDDDDDGEGKGDGEGQGEWEGEGDTNFLTSSPAFTKLCDAYRAWLNPSTTSTATPTTPPIPQTTSNSPETRRARLTLALTAPDASDADRIPSVSEYDGCGIWVGGGGSRPATPTTRVEHTRSTTTLLPSSCRPPPQHWVESPWTVASLVGLTLLNVAAGCWKLSKLTGVPLGTVLSVVGGWMGAALAGMVVVYVARHHHRYLAEEDGEGEGVCEE
ncbi:hypothetical protein B0T18DRAFT_397933 [Schizothecium vesticola]|uniref:Uncharacterized protein n=1 Tax=Schizothecium vesticola TaxID=314040 RepID=A0AA40FA42_9PEZI|nr:hypothetical protein B0T18DRAFT_397933 [Schizothecium vesticola]